MNFDVDLVLSWLALGMAGAYLANRMRGHRLPLLDALSFGAVGALVFGLAGWIMLEGMWGSTVLALLGAVTATGLAPHYETMTIRKHKWRAVSR